MEKRDYFQEALSDFAFDAACGGAIRHLSDLGYSVRQIMGRLDFPVPYDKVKVARYRHLRESGILLLQEPENAVSLPEEKPHYVRDYDAYGRTSFRLVKPREARPGTQAAWGIATDAKAGKEPMGKVLEGRIEKNGREHSYISCDFGLWDEEERQALAGLTERQREYVEDIPWERHRMYHRLTKDMEEIICALYGDGKYEGCAYFLKTRDKVFFRK